MAYKPSKKRKHPPGSEELNLIPIMNVFMIIIPFLLLTAVFAKTAVIDVYLPQEAGMGVSGGQTADADPGLLAVKVTDTGFQLEGIGGVVVIPMQEGRLDFKQLTTELMKIKERYPKKEDVVLLLQTHTPYETVVHVMDSARETTDTPRRPLFPLVSLGENR